MQVTPEIKTQIIATTGPASEGYEVLQKMTAAGVTIIRFNLAWGTLEARVEEIANIRAISKELGKPVAILADLPRFRVEAKGGHGYSKVAALSSALTPEDEVFLRFAVEHNIEYVALSFVGSEADVVAARAFLTGLGGAQKIIAKIERKDALASLEGIIRAADAVMVARGDLGNEVPLEEIPFVQHDIITKSAAAGKPAIVATQMLLSMVGSETPTRAEVSDVTTAILTGAWGVMLSEETASGKYPVLAVQEMVRIAAEVETHLQAGTRGKLIIARHHESEWNHQGLWTGTRDVHLTPYGFQKSEEMGTLLKDVRIDHAFASMQVRSIETLSSMLGALKLFHVPIEHDSAFNERDYGEYTGKNKWEMEKLVGTETFDRIRRDWDYPVPGGETLRMVYERVLPCFKEKVLPLILSGKNVLVVSHGNALRALMLYIEQIPTEDVSKIEMLFGGIVLYDLDAEGHMQHKEVRHTESHVHA